MKRKTGTGGGYFGIPLETGKPNLSYKRGVSDLQKIIRSSRSSKSKIDPFDIKCIGFGGGGINTDNPDLHVEKTYEPDKLQV